MILVTVGTQLPFERLVGAVDAWAAVSGHPVFAQVGPTERTYTHIDAVPFLGAEELEARFAAAEVIVAHAGMGSILTAMKHRKPIVIVPRKASLGEHRNEHQLATARHMAARKGITVAWEPADAVRLLDEGRFADSDDTFSLVAPEPFIDRVRAWILR